MPAPDAHRPNTTAGEPKLRHVNLMIDTLIDNADDKELRELLRNLLALSPPSVSAQFATIARGRVKRKLLSDGRPPAIASSSPLFHTSEDGSSRATEAFNQTLRAARSMYGVGLGFAALQYLTPAIQQTVGLSWEEDDELAKSLTVLDSDMTQAIQSSKEELIREGDGFDVDKAKAVVTELQLRLSEVSASVKSRGARGGEFPFEKTQETLQYWKL